MKSCAQCGLVGELITYEALPIGEGATQVLDIKLKCPEHGEYDGNWTAESAKKLLPLPEED